MNTDKLRLTYIDKAQVADFRFSPLRKPSVPNSYDSRIILVFANEENKTKFFDNEIDSDIGSADQGIYAGNLLKDFVLFTISIKYMDKGKLKGLHHKFGLIHSVNCAEPLASIRLPIDTSDRAVVANLFEAYFSKSYIAFTKQLELVEFF